MPHFGQQSTAVLDTLHPLLQKLMLDVVRHYDIKLLHGHRDQATQNQLFADGLSKLQWPDSRHNTHPSMAVDVAPWPIPQKWGELRDDMTPNERDQAWKERVKFYEMRAVIDYCWRDIQAFDEEISTPYTFRGYAPDYKIRYGHDWDGDGDYRDQTFDDLVHVEIWPIEPSLE